MSIKPIRKCIECERTMKITGRGRCGACYKRMMKNNLPNDYQPIYCNKGSFSTGGTPHNKFGSISDEQKEYLSQINSRENNPNYKHGKEIGWHKTARKAMSKYLDRELNSNEVVHHIDGDKTNNIPSNLMLFQSHSEHMKYHWKIQKEKQIKGRMVKVK